MVNKMKTIPHKPKIIVVIGNNSQPVLDFFRKELPAISRQMGFTKYLNISVSEMVVRFCYDHKTLMSEYFGLSFGIREKFSPSVFEKKHKKTYLEKYVALQGNLRSIWDDRLANGCTHYISELCFGKNQKDEFFILHISNPSSIYSIPIGIEVLEIYNFYKNVADLKDYVYCAELSTEANLALIQGHNVKAFFAEKGKFIKINDLPHIRLFGKTLPFFKK
jgi:hypothetical protein